MLQSQKGLFTDRSPLTLQQVKDSHDYVHKTKLTVLVASYSLNTSGKIKAYIVKKMRTGKKL